jgi:hypothetical protein
MHTMRMYFICITHMTLQEIIIWGLSPYGALEAGPLARSRGRVPDGGSAERCPPNLTNNLHFNTQFLRVAYLNFRFSLDFDGC